MQEIYITKGEAGGGSQSRRDASREVGGEFEIHKAYNGVCKGNESIWILGQKTSTLV